MHCKCVNAIGALDGAFYFGTSESELYRYEAPSW